MRKHKWPREYTNIDPDYLEDNEVDDELALADLREGIFIYTEDFINYEDIRHD